MVWNRFLNDKRLRLSQVDDNRLKISNDTDSRNPFESDFGRVIFSSACRRLHDKTQVFPLTTDDNIHSRLTHSLEVMNIGLSFAIYLCGNKEFKKKTNLDTEDILRKISPILKTSCLVHDIGNPPFGHFGEEVIQNYFEQLINDLKKDSNKLQTANYLSQYIINNIKNIDYIDKKEKINNEEISNIRERRRTKIWNEFEAFLSSDFVLDYTQFDGNAEGFRVLTKLQYLGDLYGLNLTYATLASTLKYPNYKPANKDSSQIGQHKHGVFITEKDVLSKIAKDSGLEYEEDIFKRHPLSFLMEAADSICYYVMDIEDANQKQWVSLVDLREEIANNENISDDVKQKLTNNTNLTKGENLLEKKEWVSYRTTLLTHLMEVATKNFVNNLQEIENGTYNKELIEDNDGVYKVLSQISKTKILPKREITSLELTGEAVISGILDAYIKLFFHTSKTFRDRGKSLISRSIFMTVLHEHREKFKDDEDFSVKYLNKDNIDELYRNFDVADFTVEERFRLIRDFVACMTDKFALEHFQKLSGQKI